MTTQELARLSDLLTWAKQRALTNAMLEEIESLKRTVDRELRLKQLDPRKE